MASSKSREECTTWLRQVKRVQSERMTPEQRVELQARVEQQRMREVSVRKCKAVKSHAVRSRALATEGLRQMASASAAPASAPGAFQAVQQRWALAQEASENRQMKSLAKFDGAGSHSGLGSEGAVAELADDEEHEEEEAMAEVAGLVGAGDMGQLMSDAAGAVAPAGGGGDGDDASTAGLLAQLRVEPEDAGECAAKFGLYEGYSETVSKMRGTLYTLHEENKPNVPPAVASDMEGQLRGIDSEEAMGIQDETREWFVFHMMRVAERNNRKMASVLDGFEKKLEFLAQMDQADCPVCFETFDAAARPAEILGCCHKVCKDCWENWTAVMHGRPFCPLCRNEAFLERVAADLADEEP